MKLTIYNKPKKEKEKEQEITLRLEYEGDTVEVVACDKVGERVFCYSLIAFTSDGRIRRRTFVNTELGFQLDKNRRIKIEGESGDADEEQC